MSFTTHSDDVLFSGASGMPIQVDEFQDAVEEVNARSGAPSLRGAPRAVAERSVMEMALYTFGDFRTAEKWMSTYHPRLRSEPSEACQGPSGMRMVVRLLQAISHGTEP